MKSNALKNKEWLFPVLFFIIFVLFTVACATVDVQPVGPDGTSVGFAALNGAVHDAIGISDFWYDFSQALGYASFAIIAFYGLTGLTQWIKRKNMLKVDSDILALGVFYLIVLAFYFIFSKTSINMRPVILDGELKPSYPSSHVMMAVSVYGSALLRIFRSILPKRVKTPLAIALALLMVLLIGSRLLSGVHWLTDILGGIMLSCAMIVSYDTACRALDASAAKALLAKKE